MHVVFRQVNFCLYGMRDQAQCVTYQLLMRKSALVAESRVDLRHLKFYFTRLSDP